METASWQQILQIFFFTHICFLDNKTSQKLDGNLTNVSLKILNWNFGKSILPYKLSNIFFFTYLHCCVTLFSEHNGKFLALFLTKNYCITSEDWPHIKYLALVVLIMMSCWKILRLHTLPWCFLMSFSHCFNLREDHTELWECDVMLLEC